MCYVIGIKLALTFVKGALIQVVRALGSRAP
jgi:hypothetical protein